MVDGRRMALGQSHREFNHSALPVNNVDGSSDPAVADARTRIACSRATGGARKNIRKPPAKGAIDEALATVGETSGARPHRNSVDGSVGAAAAGVKPFQEYRGRSLPRKRIAALQLAATLAPLSRLRLYSDTHSFSQVYFAPTTDNARRNSITAQLGMRMTAASMRGYAFRPDPPGSPGMGTTADYFAFTHSVPSWTMELGRGMAA